MSDIISTERIRKGWKGGLPETRCGAGSTKRATVQQREWLPQVIEKYGITSIADLGAGDLNWASMVDWPCDYAAYDLVPRHSDVKQLDIVKQRLPKADCYMLLWVLNHLPAESSRKVISKIKKSGARYLIMTDRPNKHYEQPDEIHMDAVERLVLNEKHDNIMVVRLDDEISAVDDSDAHRDTVFSDDAGERAGDEIS